MTSRLLALNHFANPMDEPGGTRMVELAERLQGWDTTIVAADRNLFTRRRRGRQERGFRTVATIGYEANGLSRMVGWAMYALGATLVGLRGERPDMVLASSPHLLTGLSGWVVARRWRCPFVLEVRDLWPQILVDTGRIRTGGPTHRALAALEGFLYRRADAVVVLARGVGESLVDRGLPAERVHLVPNGADPEDFVASAPREVLRRRYGFGGLTVVYAGAHGPVNGLEFVLDAAAEMRCTDPHVLFVLVGDGIARPALIARAEREGLDNVVFLQPVPKTEIPDVLAAADAGLHVLADLPLFRYGVSPNKLFDYMAAGLPVLTNTAGEIGEMVKDCEAGIQVEPAGLADGVRQIDRAGEEGRARWGRNARAFIESERRRSQVAGVLERLLDDVRAAAARDGRRP